MPFSCMSRCDPCSWGPLQPKRQIFRNGIGGSGVPGQQAHHPRHLEQRLRSLSSLAKRFEYFATLGEDGSLAMTPSGFMVGGWGGTVVL